MTDFTFSGIKFRPYQREGIEASREAIRKRLDAMRPVDPQPSPIVLGADAIRGMARLHGVTPAEFVKNAGDHVMTSLPADNEDGFALVQLNKCEWNDEENKA